MVQRKNPSINNPSWLQKGCVVPLCLIHVNYIAYGIVFWQHWWHVHCVYAWKLWDQSTIKIPLCQRFIGCSFCSHHKQNRCFFHFISLFANYRDLSWGHVEKAREAIPKGPKRSALRIVICPDPSTLLLGQDHRSSPDLDTCFASLSLSAMKRPFWKGNSNNPTYRPYGYSTTCLYNS